jgi:CelD/BcsL family acetyltransferase involved in cellulose biosynthesis
VVQREGEDTIELLRQRNAKRFKNWRRLGHKLEREVGPVILVAHDSSEAAYTQLLLWKRAQLRRSGLHDVYRPAWVQELMRNLQAAPDPDFGGLLITLYVGGQPVAGEFGVRENGCFHPWIAAYDPSLAPYSPGILLQMRIIEQMPALGLRRYDLSSGSDHYKIPMATDQLPTVAGTARAGDRAGANLSQALRRSRLGTRISQRWEQIAAAENTALGRVQGVVTAVRDGPRRWNGGGSVEV